MTNLINRRFFLAGGAAAGVIGVSAQASATGAHIMTVLGPLPVADMGFTLSHEHIVADLRPWSERPPVHEDRDKIVSAVMPYVAQAKSLGCRTIIDCTASNLGRDPRVLRAVAAKSGMHITTTTGLYAAADQQFLPDDAKTATVDGLARAWIGEWEKGIDGTGIKPGLIKVGFNGGPLTAIETTLIDAAAVTHARTGLAIGAHVGPWRVPQPGSTALSAMQQLDRLRAHGLDGSAYIWYHAQNEVQTDQHLQAAARGAWISFDGVGPGSIDLHVDLVLRMKAAGRLGQVLVSHDAGWYTIATKDGGVFKPYTPIFTDLIPALKSKGFGDADLAQLFVKNPAQAYQVRKRLLMAPTR